MRKVLLGMTALAAGILMSLGPPSAHAETSVPISPAHSGKAIGEGPAFDSSFPAFLFARPPIEWAVPTHPQARTGLWVYKVVPQHFPPSVISNFMAMASFTLRDEQHGHHSISGTNEDTLFFFNRQTGCDLTVVPSQGWMEFRNDQATARMSGKITHRPEPVVGLPQEAQLEELSLRFLKPFGIARDDLAERSDGRILTWGEKRTRGYLDKTRGQYIDDEVYLRGIYFDRRVDGVNFAGIGLGGGCEIAYGNNANIAEFKLVWRNLQPCQHRQVASPQDIMQYIREGKAVLTHKNPVNPNDIKKLTITDMSPLYMGADGEDAENYVYPFAQLEAIADLGDTTVAIQLYCPILSMDAEPFIR